MNKFPNNSFLYFFLFLPYFLVSIFFFFLVSYEGNDKQQINKLSQSIGLNELQLYIFITLFILIYSIVIFAFILFLIKIAYFFFSKKTHKNNNDLLFSVLLGLTISKFSGILLNTELDFTTSTVSITLSVVNIILIPTFYYYFSKKINLSIIAAFIMIIITIPTIIFT